MKVLIYQQQPSLINKNMRRRKQLTIFGILKQKKIKEMKTEI